MTCLRVGEDYEEGLRLRQRMATTMTDDDLLAFIEDTGIGKRLHSEIVLIQRKRKVT